MDCVCIHKKLHRILCPCVVIHCSLSPPCSSIAALIHSLCLSETLGVDAGMMAPSATRYCPERATNTVTTSACNGTVSRLCSCRFTAAHGSDAAIPVASVPLPVLPVVAAPSQQAQLQHPRILTRDRLLSVTATVALVSWKTAMFKLKGAWRVGKSGLQLASATKQRPVSTTTLS